MDGAMQNKTICIEPNAQIYPRLFIILLEVKASKKEETVFSLLRFLLQEYNQV